MGTSLQTISGWVREAKTEGAAFLIVVCDTFDWEDYPVFVMPEEDIHEVLRDYRKHSMQRVMEVYDLSLDLKEQLHERRAMHIPPEENAVVT